MKQNTAKTRMTSFLLSLLLTAPAISITSCTQYDENKKVAEPAAVDHVWKTEYISLPDNLSVYRLGNYLYQDDTISFSADRIINEETWEREPVTVHYNFTTDEITYTQAKKLDTEKYGYESYSFQTANGDLLRIFEKYDEQNQQSLYTLYRFDADGNKLYNESLNALVPESDRPYGLYVSDAFLTTDGVLYVIIDSQAVLALSAEDGSKLFDVKSDNYIDSTFTAADGTVYVSIYDYDAGHRVFRSIDKNKKAFGDALQIPESLDINNAQVFITDGYDLMIKNDTGLYGVNYTEPEPTLLCNWLNSDLVIDDVQDLALLNSELAAFIDEDPVSGTPQLCLMTPVAPEDVKPKYLIEVAYIERGYSSLPRKVVAFNRESDDYRVVLKDYNQNRNTDSSINELLTNDIVAGNVPDIIIFDSDMYDGFNSSELIDKGLFLDLYSYMDKDGETMNRDAFIPCVLGPMEHNGTLPLLAQSVSFFTLCGKESVLGKKSVWSFSDILEFTKSLKDDQYLMAEYMGSASQSEITKELFQAMFSYTIQSFIDEETATCSFDDGRFASLLQFCKEAPILDSSTIDSEKTAIQENKVALLQGSINGISDYLQLKYSTFLKDMTLIGFPTADETAKSGTVLVPSSMYGITKDSPVADGAWEFIKRTFGSTSQNRYYHEEGISSSIAALEEAFEKQKLTYYEFSEHGWGATMYDEGDEINPNWEQDALDNGAVPGHFEEEDRQAILDLINNTTLVFNTDQKILSLIEEDVSAYFAGVKSLEETVNLVQNRVSIYVSETKG